MPLRRSACRLALCALLALTFFSTHARSQGVSVEEANDDQREKARVTFAEARKAFDDRRFLEALKSFRASFEVVASPNTHLMIAHTLRELGRDADAYTAFEAVAEQAEAAIAKDEKYRKTAQIAREELDKLRGSVGLLTVEVRGAGDDATLRIENKVVERDRWGKPIAVTPGKVAVLLSSGGKNQVREVNVTAGGAESLAIEPPSDGGTATPDPGDDDDRPDRTTEPEGPNLPLIIGIAAGGVGVVGFALAGVFGGLALGKHNDLEAACGDAPCPPGHQDEIDSGRTFQTVSNVMIVVGAVGVAAGAGLIIYSFVADDSASAEEARLTVGPGWIGVRGSF
ncbi:MAG TPA: hypothetical protein VFB62_21865 [Polyangiaceae bacterium]|nr:hypothetical protein [Polyangiaceae bacterium]